MRFMYQFPESSGALPELPDVGSVSELAVAAEAAGFGGFAFTEHPAPSEKWMSSGGHHTLDPFVALGHVAAVTTTMKLLTYLSVAPYRNPMLLAKAAATVDIVSGGRFILGLGTGYLKGEFRAIGVDFEERNALFDEALDVLPMHWSGEPFSYQGRHFEARDTVARPVPPRAGIPIWIGGNSQLTRRRVAERAAGWMPMTGPAELFRTTRTPALDEAEGLAEAIAALRGAAGDRGEEIDVMVAYTDRSILEPGADLASHVDALGRLEAAGVTWVAIPGATTSRDHSLKFLEQFGATCIRR
ncbi:MAG TPA: LLM class F420-dependent oxidoreductase [Mycobacteriales bacterium]|jgi:probable F420-dependent oxidoreductase|nr:LLM class F420-dependent oxidoreductase [Mycobacteriales bacterium]